MRRGARTTITKRGQTVVPASIRRRHRLEEGDRLLWLDDGEVLRVVPLVKDPIRELRGAAKGEGLTEALLRERRRDRARGS